MATEKTNIPVPEEHVGQAEDVQNATVREEAAAAAVPAAETAPETDETAEEAVETVNFDEENAVPSGAQAEIDMDEETDDERTQAQRSDAETARHLEDISRLNKHQLVELSASLLESKPVQQRRREAEAVKVAFYKLHRAEYE